MKDLEITNSRLEKGQEELKTSQGRIEKKLDQSIFDNAEFFNEAGIFFDEMKKDIEKRLDDHEIRLSQLEVDNRFPRGH